jgi:low affinity Fe/Cu permease
MAKVKVKVLNATVDGKGPNSVITIEEKSAKHLESIGYVERVAKSSNTNNGGSDE